MSLVQNVSLLADQVRLTKGGTVADACGQIYVDGFGADPTGVASSSAAVASAVAAANMLTNSVLNKDRSIPYLEVVFGPGTYKCIDILLKSGIGYRGAPGYGTLITPDDTVTSTTGYVFATTGTQPYSVGREPGRGFRIVMRDFVIGYDRQRIYADAIPANNIGGVQIKYSSYCAMENVQFNTLDGIGLSLAEVWDSYFKEVRILNCGNVRNPANVRYALQVFAGEALDTGCDTLRFDFLHIENTTAGMYIGPRSSMITFNAPKFEMGKSVDCVSNIIAGVDGLIMNSPQLSWSLPTVPMFSMVGTNATGNTNTNNEGDLNTNHNRRVFINSPQVRNSQNNIGWYFSYGSDRGPLVISGGSSQNVRYLVTGKNFRVYDHSFVGCYMLMYGTDDVIVSDCNIVKQRAPAAGTPVTTPVSLIVLTGTGNAVRNTRFDLPYGSSSDTNICIQSNSSSVVECTGNTFSGTWGIAMQLGGDVSARIARDNKILAGSSIGVLYNGTDTYEPINIRRTASIAPVGISTEGTVAADAIGTFANVIGGATSIHVRVRNTSGTYIGAAELFTDVSGTTIKIKADVEGNFTLQGGGSGTPGDGKMYVGKTGSSFTLVNRATTSVIVDILSISAM